MYESSATRGAIKLVNEWMNSITSSWYLFHWFFSNDFTWEMCFPNERWTLQHWVHSNIALFRDAHVASRRKTENCIFFIYFEFIIWILFTCCTAITTRFTTVLWFCTRHFYETCLIIGHLISCKKEMNTINQFKKFIKILRHFRAIFLTTCQFWQLGQ